MAQVSIRINGRSYDIACDDGQEDRIHALAGYVNDRVKEIADAVGQIGEQRFPVADRLRCAVRGDQEPSIRGLPCSSGSLIPGADAHFSRELSLARPWSGYTAPTCTCRSRGITTWPTAAAAPAYLIEQIPSPLRNAVCGASRIREHC